MKKAKAIEEFQKEPIKVGDWIKLSRTNKTFVVDSIEGNNLVINELSGRKTDTKITQDQVVEKNPYKVGANPFKQTNVRLRFINFSIDSILHSIGFESEPKIINGVEVQRLNWNPTITNSEGKKIPYQRGFVWSQKDKQLLIESIYQGLDIGKIVLKKNSYKFIEEQISLGNNVAFKDVVDGKQRLNALLEFVQDKFEDLHGNLFSDLSEQAQNKFMSFQGVSYGELDEDTTDAEIQETFVNINFTGVQMSQEHIDYVRAI